MNKEIAEKWVEALRSGEYKQTKDVLQDCEGYCCLGVLCGLGEEAEIKVEREGDQLLHGNYLDDQEHIKEWSGISTKKGDLGNRRSLADMNDNGADFYELADIIEKEWENL